MKWCWTLGGRHRKMGNEENGKWSVWKHEQWVLQPCCRFHLYLLFASVFYISSVLFQMSPYVAPYLIWYNSLFPSHHFYIYINCPLLDHCSWYIVYFICWKMFLWRSSLHLKLGRIMLFKHVLIISVCLEMWSKRN